MYVQLSMGESCCERRHDATLQIGKHKMKRGFVIGPFCTGCTEPLDRVNAIL